MTYDSLPVMPSFPFERHGWVWLPTPALCSGCRRSSGPATPRELAFTGEDIDAARAKEIGLVNDVFDDPATLFDAANTLAGEIARMSPLVTKGVKNVLAANHGRTVAEALDYVAHWNTSFLFSNDLLEAMNAFLEQRDPEFKGK